MNKLGPVCTQLPKRVLDEKPPWFQGPGHHGPWGQRVAGPTRPRQETGNPWRRNMFSFSSCDSLEKVFILLGRRRHLRNGLVSDDHASRAHGTQCPETSAENAKHTCPLGVWARGRCAASCSIPASGFWPNSACRSSGCWPCATVSCIVLRPHSWPRAKSSSVFTAMGLCSASRPALCFFSYMHARAVIHTRYLLPCPPFFPSWTLFAGSREPL